MKSGFKLLFIPSVILLGFNLFIYWGLSNLSAELQLQRLDSMKTFTGQVQTAFENILQVRQSNGLGDEAFSQENIQQIARSLNADIQFFEPSGERKSTELFGNSHSKVLWINIPLSAQFSQKGYGLRAAYSELLPMIDPETWTLYGTIVFLIGSILLLFWLSFLNRQQNKSWKEISSSINEPRKLRSLNTSGMATNIATIFAEKAEQNESKYQDLRLELEDNKKQLLQAKRSIQSIKNEHNKLLQAPRLKSGFLSRMGDEITVPMKSVSNMLKLLSEFNLAHEPKEILGIAIRSQQQLSSNIQNILDFSKLDAGLLKLLPAEFEIDVLIQELIRELTPHAESKQLKIEWSLNDRVPMSCVGDRQRIYQILFNLAANAIRFTKEGQIGIYVDSLYDRGKQYIRYTVKDTGIGLPKEAIETLFDSLEPHTKLTNSSFAGRIKLIVSRQLTELMGGKIGVSSEVGEGSRFWFTVLYKAPN